VSPNLNASKLLPTLLRASRWFAGQGYRNEAARHAISAGDWERAADLIELGYELVWVNSEHAMVRRWLENLPVEIIRTRPRLCLAYAKTLFMVAPYATVARWLHDAERALRAAEHRYPSNARRETTCLEKSLPIVPL